MNTAPSAAARGFTLVELLITMSILSIALAIAVPSFSETAATQRVRSLATDLHTTLLRARSEAIKRNGDVEVRPLAGGWASGWELVDVGGPDGDEIIEVRQDVARAVSVSGPGSLVFESTGRLASAAELQVSSDVESAVQRCVRTDLSGRPYVAKGACL